MGDKVDRLIAMSYGLDGAEADLAVALSGSLRDTPGGKLNFSPKNNWVDNVGGLPKYIEDMAIHMMQDSGLTREHAIPASVERTKVLAAKGNHRAIEALAEWDAKRAKSHAMTAAKDAAK